MIHYQLRCGREHGFDGWFRDSAAFEAQARRGLIACPECGDTREIARAIMAPAVATRAGAATIAGSGRVQPENAAILPDAVRAALQRLRAEVEKTCDNVGGDFAEEARRIHRGQSDRGGIYGDAQPEQAEALVEEGIQIARIPWLPRADS